MVASTDNAAGDSQILRIPKYNKKKNPRSHMSSWIPSRFIIEENPK
jgi:hypothetical protein